MVCVLPRILLIGGIIFLAVFKYFAPHTVDEVSAAGYASCSAASRLSAASGGTTTVALNAAGKRYFICGVPGDCRKGMKLVVHVAA
jgi:hypothetical protein